MRSPFGEMELVGGLDCGGHGKPTCVKIHRAILDTERKKRQYLCTIILEVKWVILFKNHLDDKKQMGGCQELGVGLTPSISMREFGGNDRNILSLDCGGGYMAKHLSKFIELCTPETLFYCTQVKKQISKILKLQLKIIFFTGPGVNTCAPRSRCYPFLGKYTLKKKTEHKE